MSDELEVTLVDHYRVEDHTGNVLYEGGTRHNGKTGVVTFACRSRNFSAAITALNHPGLRNQAIEIASQRGLGPCGINGMASAPYAVDQYKRPITHGNAAIDMYMIDIPVTQRLV